MAPENRRRRKVPQHGPTPEQMLNWSPEEVQARLHQEAMERPVAELEGLGVRVTNMMETNNIILVKDLMAKHVDELMAIRNFSNKTLEAVRASLRAIGLTPTWGEPSRKKK